MDDCENCDHQNEWDCKVCGYKENWMKEKEIKLYQQLAMEKHAGYDLNRYKSLEPIDHIKAAHIEQLIYPGGK